MIEAMDKARENLRMASALLAEAANRLTDKVDSNALLDKIKNLPPMTAHDLFEQRVSWVHGQTGIHKDKVRKILRQQEGRP